LLSVYALDRYLLYTRENKDMTIQDVISSPFSLLTGLSDQEQEQQKMRNAVLEQLRQDVQEDYIKSQDPKSSNHANQKDIPIYEGLMTMEEALSPSTPILFHAKVRRIPAMFDGTMSLKGTHLGDIVSVVQEHVGPSGMYHLCRLTTSTNTNKSTYNEDEKKEEEVKQRTRAGWFPISHLEKLDSNQ